MTTRILPMGERALLVEVDDLAAVLAVHARLEASRPPGVVDLVPAARTVLVVADPRRLPLAAARSWIARESERVADTRPVAHAAPDIEVPVVYDGPDLADTARLLGLAESELVRRHTSARWMVAFTGFAPGFGYLVSDDWVFDVPRLTSPRTRVPAGAVGLAAGFTGAYPRSTPGGWRLIATTSVRLFDADAARPALLEPGARVRFAAERPGIRAAAPAQASVAEIAPADGDPAGIQVVEPGPLATVQDLGRAGSAHVGVSRSGALDRGALRLANRLVGNEESAAGLEIALGGFRAVAVADQWIAITGAWGGVTIGGAPVDPYAATEWPAGEELVVAAFTHGLRAYLAVRGGIAGPAVLGSRATDLLAGLGPAVLRSGTQLEVGVTVAGPIPAAEVAPWSAPVDDEIDVELAPGPRADWVAETSLSALFEQVWTVSPRSDRVGMRLDGVALERTRGGELASEGVVPGAIQVPPDGLPTILLADGPVTGGYPVVAVVTDAGLDALAQAHPGTRVRFRHAR